ncbi:ABC transporter substrate-binding protein [Microlunatus parietis]|uniref:Peptide/nickel transport system substrate-binding protein n=1 Tax=Microlunatus parietis TaxID=682979 RepID=A0A7Y9LB60_9ACTN|nr:ABC transporter substrate-binding protein [Microlunatus parietis]NYE70483.1 peptide/nickel transport system substrate-binding protein [Microlunatus parietis]
MITGSSRSPFAGQSRRGFLGTAGIALGALAAGCTAREPLPPTDGAGAAALESPVLVEQVQAGKLPALADRLPKVPQVVQPVAGEGKHGGTLHRAQTEPTDNASVTAFASAGLIEWNFEATGPQPSLAEEYTRSEDNKIFTFVLREGLKWSDGEPFGVDDLLFAFQDWIGNSTLVPAIPVWFADADQKLPKITKQDERTLVLTFTQSFALFEKYLCHPAVSIQLLKPKHYLQQFHAEYADQAELEAATRKAGFDSWDQYFADRCNPWTNPDLPVLGAYRVSKAAGPGGTATLDRNPYYHKTDPAGRQLPYIDKLQVQVLDQAALDLRASNGDLDFQGHFLGYNTTQVYLQNADSKGFRVLRWKPTASLLALAPNLSHADPVWRELFATKDFRHALSYAIDREEINQTLLGGLGVIRQPVSTEGSPYGIEGGGTTAIEHDPDRANQLLDGLGLERQGDLRRYRGKPLEFTLTYLDSNFEIPRADAFNLVRKHWAAVGVKINLRPVDDTLYLQLRVSNDFDIDGTTTPEDDWDLEPVWFIPTSPNSHTAPGYGMWYNTSGKDGIEPSAEFKQLITNWERLRTAATDEDRIAAGQAITQQHHENVYVIGLMKLPFKPVIVNTSIKGVREDEPKLSFYYGREGITKPEQIYYAD